MIIYLTTRYRFILLSIVSVMLLFSVDSFASNSIDDSAYQGYQLRFSAEVNSVDSANKNDYSLDVITYIVGGDDSQRDYPWMVALYDADNFICGGVLISARWIATAAHCVYENDDNSGDATAYDAANYRVVIGESMHYSSINRVEAAGIDVHPISNIIIQPNYDSDTVDYDIALLELASPYYQPGPALATAERFAMIEEGDLISTIGYGVMSVDDNASDNEVIPRTLQEADLPFIETGQCYWNEFNMLTDNMFCAGYESTDINIDSCSGDSGGPLVMTIDGELTLVGLVSWGASSCSDVPGVYTNISHLRSWILANIDGYQVVEEGVVIYDHNSDSYTSGLISVYQYGTAVNNYLSIGDLSFDNVNYNETLDVMNSCSNNDLYETEGNDARCEIQFDLTGQIDEDLLFNATLKVNVNEEIDLSIVNNTNVSSTVLYDGSSSTSSGGLGFISLFMLVLSIFFRISFLSRK